MVTIFSNTYMFNFFMDARNQVFKNLLLAGERSRKKGSTADFVGCHLLLLHDCD
jgi:hypothetical protein